MVPHRHTTALHRNCLAPTIRWFSITCGMLLLITDATLAWAQDTSTPSPETPNKLLQQLTTSGISFPGGLSVVMEPPILLGIENAGERQAKLDRMTRGIGWERFSRNSPVAPIEIDLQYLRDANGQRVGHSIHVACVAHVRIEQLRDEQLMEGIFSSEVNAANTSEYRVQKATAAELAAWNLPSKDESVSYFKMQIPLLDRVLVAGWLQVQHTEDDQQITLSWVLDPRFASDADPDAGNYWKHISTSPDDDDEVRHRYEGFAGYLRISRLDQPAGASFVEARMVIYEPVDWFRGSNLLRSKLPLMLQESVRTFRRKWSEIPK